MRFLGGPKAALIRATTRCYSLSQVMETLHISSLTGGRHLSLRVLLEPVNLINLLTRICFA